MTGDIITSAGELENLVIKYGFLPFFRNEIPGFSAEEHTPLGLWFSELEDGPWEWKGPVAKGKTCVYGKLFRGRAGFVSLEYFPDFLNYRRDGYDFDARYDDGKAPRKDKQIYDTLSKNGSMLTPALKVVCGYGKHGLKGFDGAITRLQMQTYVCVSDFEYMTDRHGKPYGWGVARYAAPEALFGENTVRSAYECSPETSKERIRAHLTKLLPQASEARIAGIIG